MSDWGEDDLEGVEAQPIDISEADSPMFGIDVRSLVGPLVDIAVQSAITKEVSKEAQSAIKTLINPEIRTAIRQRAEEAAAKAIKMRVDELESGEREEELSPPSLYYGSVDAFVRDYLRLVYRRRIDGRHRCWAGRWWQHDEAVIRLEALWRSWEHLRHDAATGMSVWWRDHADHHMAALMDPDGPFATATEGEENMSKRGEPLPYVAPPEGMFPDVRREDTDSLGESTH